jgi:hypothetical protein
LGGQFDKDARRRWQLVIELNKLKISSFDAQGLVAFAEWRWLSFHIGMAPKYHPTPVSGSHRKALAKGLTRTRDDIDSRAARGRNARRRRSDDPRSGRPAFQSWNERMWADGEPVDPRRRSTSRSMAVIPGLRSPVRVAAHRAPSTSLRFRTCRRPSCTTLRDGCDARNAATLACVRRRSCGNSRSGRGMIRTQCQERTDPPPRYLAQQRDLADLPRERPYRHHRTTRRRTHRCRTMGLALRLPFRISTWPRPGHGR